MKKIELDRRRRQKSQWQKEKARWNAEHPSEATLKREENSAKRKYLHDKERKRTYKKILKKKIQRVKSQHRKFLISDELYKSMLKDLNIELGQLK